MPAATTPDLILDFEKKFASLESDEERCTAYRSFLEKIDMVDLETTKAFTACYLYLADKSGLTEHLAAAHKINGIQHIFDAEFPEALLHLNQSLSLFRELSNKKSEAEILDIIGTTYARSYFSEQAIEYLILTIELAEEIGYKKLAFSAKGNLAATYSSIGLYQNAREIYLDLISSKHVSTGLYLNLSADYEIVGDLEKADKALLKCRDLVPSETQPEVIATFYANYAHYLLRKGFKDDAIGELGKSISLAEKYGAHDTTRVVFVEAGKFYTNAGEWDKAETSLKKALELARKVGVKQNISLVLNSLKDLSVNRGKYNEALDYAEQFIAVEKELKDEQVKNVQRMLEVKQQFSLVQKEKEITDIKNKELEEKNIIIEEEKKLVLLERDRSNRLLLNILPYEVAEELKAKEGKDETVNARQFENVTVLYTDFKDFTLFSEQVSAQALVTELDTCFRAFDAIMGNYNIEKIKTMGDAYMAASGLPVSDPAHAVSAVSAAIEVRDFMLNRKKELGGKTLEIRIGLHTGRVVAGIVGVKKYAYDIWGDTVNTAARMEQNSEPGKINISEATYGLVKDKFDCHYRGNIEAKNKGKLKMYFVQ